MKDTPKPNSRLNSGVVPISSTRNAAERMGTHWRIGYKPKQTW